MDVGAVALVSFGIIIFAAMSKRLRRSVITAPIVFVSFGLLIGDGGLELVGGHVPDSTIHLLGELTLVVVLFADASRIDLKLLRREHDLPIRLLAIGMPLGIALGTITAWWLFPQLGVWQAAILATIVAPTDAALAHAVVTNESVPVRVRQTISVESGLNDGLCLPLLLLFACAARAAEHPETTAYWIQFGAMQVLIGPLVGLILAFLCGKLIDCASARRWISHSFLEISTIALALLAFAAAEIVGGNGLIAAFCAGLTIGNVSPTIRSAIHEFADAEGQLLTLLVFLVFGAVLLPRAAAHLTGAAIVFSVFALTVVRVLPVVISLARAGLRRETQLFVGWFGPRGVASIVFALTLLDEASLPGSEEIFAVAMMTVALSVFSHGVSAYPASKWYSSRLHAAAEIGECAEHKVVGKMSFRS